MNKIYQGIIGLVLVSISSAVFSDSLVEQETQHLLNYIGGSGCVFIRNDSEYSPEKARSHILRKYKHVKDKVGTTEEVIEYAATESSFTGKAYLIKCPEEDVVPSSEWLTAELEVYRIKENRQQVTIKGNIHLNDANFSAVGNEPGWYLLKNSSHLILVSDYGTSRVDVELPAPTMDENEPQVMHWDMEGFSLEIRNAICNDSMSDEIYSNTVVVTTGNKTLYGCGKMLD